MIGNNQLYFAKIFQTNCSHSKKLLKQVKGQEIKKNTYIILLITAKYWTEKCHNVFIKKIKESLMLFLKFISKVHQPELISWLFLISQIKKDTDCCCAWNEVYLYLTQNNFDPN